MHTKFSVEHAIELFIDPFRQREGTLILLFYDLVKVWGLAEDYLHLWLLPCPAVEACLLASVLIEPLPISARGLPT